MKYFAERLKSARLMNGLSLQGLADRIDNKVTKQALSKYEQGQVIPDSEMIGVLADSLEVRPDYFYSDTEVMFGEIEFRKLKKHSNKEKAKIIELAKDNLRRYIELEEILGIEYVFDNPLKDCEIKSRTDVENAAKQLRKKWKLGADSLFNVIELLEDHHIKVLELPAPDAFDGFSTWVNEKIPLIVLNKDKLQNTLDRKRLTALHELAHLLLSDLEDFEEKEKERLCHYFAAAMLVPEDTLKKELGGKRNRLSFRELGALKQQYGISMQALAYRAKELGFVSDNYLKQFFFMFTQMGYRTQEPVAYQGYEHSNRFSQLLFRALAEEFISISKAASLNNQRLAEFRKENLLM